MTETVAESRKEVLGCSFSLGVGRDVSGWTVFNAKGWCLFIGEVVWNINIKY